MGKNFLVLLGMFVILLLVGFFVGFTVGINQNNKMHVNEEINLECSEQDCVIRCLSDKSEMIAGKKINIFAMKFEGKY